jgi:hypothetical protein
MKTIKLFHKNIEWSNKSKCFSVIIMRKIFIPYRIFKIKFSKIKNEKIYFFDFYLFGWDILSIGLIL